MLERVFALQAETLVDSTLASTRVYWRKEVLGLPDEIANDPRPLRDVLAELSNASATADSRSCGVTNGEQ